MNENINLMDYNEEMEVEPNKVVICPIYFEDGSYGGNLARIENFTHIKFGTIRTSILNNKPYFSINDVYKAIGMTNSNATRDTKRKVDRIKNYYLKKLNNSSPSLGWSGVTPSSGWSNPEYKVTPSSRWCHSVDDLNYIKSIEQSLYKISTQYYYIPTTYILKYRNDGSPVYRTSNMMYICEGLLYDILLNSEKDEALEFRFVICNELLPRMSIIGKEKSIQLLDNEISKLNNIISNKDTEISKLNIDISNMQQTINNGENQFAYMNGIIEGQSGIISSNNDHIHNLEVSLNNLVSNANDINEVKQLLYKTIECLNRFTGALDNKYPSTSII